MKGNIVALVSGTMFGLGLAISEMTNPEKVLGFLDIFGRWDPSVAFVMGGAVAVTALTFRYVKALPKPLFAARFEVPTSTAIDRPLLVGAVLFGIGWGTAGFCPGPAIASITMGSSEPPIFLLALLVGNYLAGRWQTAGSTVGQTA